MDVTVLARRCPRCGRPLAADAPEGLCPACLLGTAEGSLTQLTSGDTETVQAAAVGAGAATSLEARLEPGQRFGAYRIGALLGRGGMGEVYDATHVETGRRLALKVLRGRLHDADDRARFLHEGQLAASVSHPHTVYIFGSEVIDGVPVITMELLPGGTLRDRVAAGGPLPPAEAVSAVLDIVGGLDAAQAAGILHRDIKPSNCFLDSDGAVKVGDFGLSISTLARDVHAAAAPEGFQGTPQFAPPEQLRGEPLDLRADIYAVGATLYYLLTGRAPFDARDLTELFRRATTEAPPSPRALQPGVPPGLADLVLQCLAKDPRQRPATYAVLAEALKPYSTAHTRPAPMPQRVVAGLIDAVIIGLPVAIWNAAQFTPVETPSTGVTVRIDGWTWAVSYLYYLLLEGATGATIGKRLFGLRVTAPAGPPGWGRISLRTTLFHLPAAPLAIPMVIVGRDAVVAFLSVRPALATLATLSTLLLTLALFVTARRRNGYAALHDLGSRTRVVAREAAVARRQATPGQPDREPPGAADLRGLRCGPFDVVGDLGATDHGRLLAAFDPVLRRRVWIHMLPTGTPEIAAPRRDVGRPARLRWLTGRRAPGENWDAFEAPPGEPLLTTGDQPWAIVKGWLLDLAAELAAAERDGTMSALDLTRVWIRRDGRALLLDVPAPGVPPRSAGSAEPTTPVPFLAAVARRALGAALEPGPHGDGPPRLPVSAAALIERWRRSTTESVVDARLALTAVARAADAVSRWRRAVPIAAAAVPIAVLTAGALAAVPMFMASVSPERLETIALLEALDAPVGSSRAPADDVEREAIEVYLTGRHGATLRALDTAPPATGPVAARLADIAARLIDRRTAPHPVSVEQAAATIAPRLRSIRARYETTLATSIPRAVSVIVAVLAAISLAAACIVSLVAAAVAPGGLLFRGLGLTVVDAAGREVTRARSLGRALLAWSPAIVWLLWLLPSPIDQMRASAISPLVPAGIAIATLAAGGLWTIARPARGPHDRLARTWVVPR